MIPPMRAPNANAIMLEQEAQRERNKKKRKDTDNHPVSVHLRRHRKNNDPQWRFGLLIQNTDDVIAIRSRNGRISEYHRRDGWEISGWGE